LATPIRFLVAEHPGQPWHHDSYILPLGEPAAIAHARHLIAVGPAAGQPIVVAQIAAGANGINRNYLAAGSPPWSWHVARFESFADTTIEILDGWPGYVESDVPGWLANTGGYIGFWTYTVVAEVPVGDYTADFAVDIADYAAWRLWFGSTTDLSADGNGSEVVEAADYLLWRKHLATARLPSAKAGGVLYVVPEPSGCYLLGLLALLRMSRRSLHTRCAERIRHTKNGQSPLGKSARQKPVNLTCPTDVRLATILGREPSCRIDRP